MSDPSISLNSMMRSPAPESGISSCADDVEASGRAVLKARAIVNRRMTVLLVALSSIVELPAADTNHGLRPGSWRDNMVPDDKRSDQQISGELAR
jgi:hypothetical protein